MNCSDTTVGIDLATSPKTRQVGAEADWKTSFQLEAFLEKWGNALIATARRYSPTATDADDAYQRAIEILLTKFPDCDSEEHLVAWVHTVIRNEALQMHRSSKSMANGEFERIAESLVAEEPIPEESAVFSEELAWGREALARIRPEQTRCLLLKADGLSNPEICETTGFSYAKVNRLLSEGRKALSTQTRAIEGGRECQRIEPMLLVLVDGNASASMLADIEPHLDHCVACRATLRDLRDAPSSIAALLPIGTALPAAAGTTSWWARCSDQLQAWATAIQERLLGQSVAQGGEVLTAKKFAVAASIAAAVVGGGVAVERSIDAGPIVADMGLQPAGGIGGTLDSAASAIRPRADGRAVGSRDVRGATAADAARVIESNESVDAPRSVAEEPEADTITGDPRDAVPRGVPTDSGQDVGALAP